LSVSTAAFTSSIVAEMQPTPQGELPNGPPAFPPPDPAAVFAHSVFDVRLRLGEALDVGCLLGSACQRFSFSAFQLSKAPISRIQDRLSQITINW